MSDAQELITIPDGLDKLAAFTKEEGKGLQPFLDQIRGKVDAFVPDVTTAAGRKAIASMAYKLARSSTILDDVGKELVAEMKKLPAAIDKNRKYARDQLEAWKGEVRAPLDQWEAKEKARVDGHVENVAAINYMTEKVETNHELTAEHLRGLAARCAEFVVDDRFEEFKDEYRLANDRAKLAIAGALTRSERREADAAELARLRAESDARAEKDRQEATAREAAERVRLAEAAKIEEERRREEAQRLAVESAAQAERDAATAREQALKDEIERNQREAAEREAAIRREAEAAEAKRLKDAADALAREEAEKRRLEQEAAARAADREHHAEINREAAEALIVGGLTDDQAKIAVSMIARGQVPHIAITY